MNRRALLLVPLLLAAGLPAHAAPNQVTNPLLNASDIWWDPANSSTHASDNNSCVTQALPCRTQYEIVTRLGGINTSYVHQGTHQVIHVMSSNAPGDELRFMPYAPIGSQVAIEGVLAQVGSSCTLGTVTAKNTAANAGTRLVVAATCITATNQFVMNSTHVSNAWAIGGAGPWTMTQPLTPCDAATNTCNRVEVNNWTTGDTITVWTMPNLYVDFSGGFAGAGSGYIGFTHVCFAGGGNNFTGYYPVIWEDCQLAGASVGITGEWPEAANYNMEGGTFIFSAPLTASLDLNFSTIVPAVRGGYFQDGTDIEGAVIANGADLEHGVVASGLFGDVYLGTPSSNRSVLLAPGQNMMLNTASGGLVWGPGSFNLLPGSHLGYIAGQSTSVFLNGAAGIGGIGSPVYPGTAVAGGNAQWCASQVGSASATQNCNIVGSAANMEAAYGTGCAGNCWWPGGYGLVAFTR